jgi:RNA polymerase sigma-70 factor (ECF subfamily)
VTRPDVGVLFRAHAEAVESVLLRLVADVVEVDDLLQDVFATAHRKRARVPSNAEHAKSWLLDVARKKAANWRRLFRHTHEVLGCPAVVRRAVAEPGDPEAHLALCNFVLHVLEELEEPERRILVLHHVVGETLEELGAQFGVTRSAAHARLEKAEKRMRRIMLRYG